MNKKTPFPYFLYSNMAQIIDGSGLAKDLRCELRKELEQFVAAGNRAPHLTAIIVGEDPASKKYVANKVNACKEIGISSCTKVLPASTTQEELLELIHEQNSNPNVNGILVQLPVPDHMDERTICDAVCAEKDVDGFNEVNIGRLALDMDCKYINSSRAIFWQPSQTYSYLQYTLDCF